MHLREIFEHVKTLSEESLEIINRRVLDDDLNIINHEHQIMKSKQTTKKRVD
jgi:hypothetical protein